MSINGIRWVWVFLGMVGLSSLPALASDLYPLGGDSDFTVLNDRSPTELGFIFIQTWVGDFNGDGIMDLAINTTSPDSRHSETNVLFGPVKKSNRLSVDSDFRVTPAITEIGDLNNDHVNDFVIAESTRVSIIFGKVGLTGEVDLYQSNADVVFTLSANHLVWGCAVGNFNGDAYTDLAILDYSSSPSVCRILFGPSSFAQGTYAISTIPNQTVIRFSNSSLNEMGARIFSKDIDKDGMDEIVLFNRYRTTTDELFGVASQINRGRKTWPSLWDMETTPADFTMNGVPESTLNILSKGNYGIGDLTGDGLKEMALVYKRPYPAFEQLFLMDGAFITSSTPAVINIHPGQPGAIFTTPVLSGFYTLPLATGDFDGDGREDFFFSHGPPDALKAVISSDFPTGFPVAIDTPSFSIHGGNEMSLGDLNGDGRADLLVSITGLFQIPEGFASSAVFGYYGFRPFRNPQAVVKKLVDARWVDVTLSVKGDPVQMRFSGDVDASVLDQWIPYRSDYRVPLSPLTGPKSIQVTFRNTYQRMSDPVTFQATVDTPDAGITPVTNRIHPGEKAHWDLRVPHSTHVRARILMATGEPLLEIYNNDGGPGVVSLEWNGQNSAGQSVAPGVYVLVVDMDSQHFKTTVLVR